MKSGIISNVLQVSTWSHWARTAGFYILYFGLVAAPVLFNGCGKEEKASCPSGYYSCPSFSLANVSSGDCCEEGYPFNMGASCSKAPPPGPSAYCGPSGSCSEGYNPCPVSGMCCSEAYPFHVIATGECWKAPPGGGYDEYCYGKNVYCNNGWYICPQSGYCCPVGYPFLVISEDKCYMLPPGSWDEYCGPG